MPQGLSTSGAHGGPGEGGGGQGGGWRGAEGLCMQEGKPPG